MSDDLIAELEAKAWQSSSRRKSSGGLSKHSDHVCWRAAACIRELEALVSGLSGAISWLEPPFVTADTDDAEVLKRVDFMLGDVARARALLTERP